MIKERYKMAKWNYTIKRGKELRKAINDGDVELVIKCLLRCYKELYSKLSDEDKDWKGFDIEDTIEILTTYSLDPDDEDDVDYYLYEFYNLCDDLRAWVAV